MVAQDMRDIGVGLAEADDEGEEIADRAAGATGVQRQPQRTKAGPANEIDDLERQNAVALAVTGALGDLVKERLQLRRAGLERFGCAEGGGGHGLVHSVGLLLELGEMVGHLDRLG
ncbi:hypothetical protein ACVWXN_004682 [Bradyrhizobium sp. i1.4.4]